MVFAGIFRHIILGVAVTAPGIADDIAVGPIAPDTIFVFTTNIKSEAFVSIFAGNIISEIIQVGIGTGCNPGPGVGRGESKIWLRRN